MERTEGGDQPDGVPGSRPARSLPVSHRSPLVLAVGGSAGSLGPLLELVGSLPPDLPASVLVTVHLGDSGRSQLAGTLARASRLPVAWAVHGEPLLASRVYVAPAGSHLLIRHGSVSLSGGPKVNRHRPSIDAMFVSAAEAAGGGAVVLVMSGVLDDGAVGAALVAAAGGHVLAQDPAEAEFPGMPAAALSAVPAAPLLTRARAAATVTAAVTLAASRPRQTPNGRHPETTTSTTTTSTTTTNTTPEAAMSMTEGSIDYLSDDESRLTRLSCPDCGGSLAQVDLAQLSYFRCHVGHQFGPQALAAAQAEASESKLWSALAAIEEETAFQRYLGSRLPDADVAAIAHRRLADDLAARAAQLREQVHAWVPVASDSPQA